ncbi:UDP-3-O-acyl-N-acetylglucosamine deacetylase, partial [bacterium]|nr:UDP-3-O-acyl-N-acetylglucosamine deacetylase [bacterium]
MNQKTIVKEATYSGVGLHTGERITITFKPAPVDNGISFIRTDLGRKEIKATLDKIVKSERESTLKERQTEIHTVEHLLAALSGLSISNLFVEINGPEPPIGDGSALCYLEVLSSAGIVSQNKPWPEIKVASPIEIREEGQRISIYPDSQLKITYTLGYEHQAIKDQTATFIINEETFKKEIAPARTFGFLSEVRELRSQG